MSRRSLLIAALIGAVGLSALAADDPDPTVRAVYPHEFPEGPGQSLAQRSCLTCHGATLVTQQAKDSTGWEKTLTQMEAWGVKLTPAERETLRSYLAAHFAAKRRP